MIGCVDTDRNHGETHRRWSSEVRPPRMQPQDVTTAKTVSRAPIVHVSRVPGMGRRSGRERTAAEVVAEKERRLREDPEHRAEVVRDYPDPVLEGIGAGLDHKSARSWWSELPSPHQPDR